MVWWMWASGPIIALGTQPGYGGSDTARRGSGRRVFRTKSAQSPIIGVVELERLIMVLAQGIADRLRERREKFRAELISQV